MRMYRSGIETTKDSMWIIVTLEEDSLPAVHIIPLGDIMEHRKSRHCWCNPDDDGFTVVHKSLDEREYHENGGLLH